MGSTFKKLLGLKLNIGFRVRLGLFCFDTACVQLTASVCRVGRTRVPGDLISFRGESTFDLVYNCIL